MECISLCACMALLACTLSASAFMQWAIRKSATCRFLLKKNLWRLVPVLLWSISITHCCPHTCSWFQYNPCTCAPTNGVQHAASTLCPPVFPAKKAQAVSPSYAHSSPENFLTIGGYFECYKDRVTALGWLKKEEGERKKKMNDSDFQLFHFCYFKIKIFTTRCYYYCRLGQALYKVSIKYF